MWREMFKMGLALGLGARIASMDSSDVRVLLRMGKRAVAKAREWYKPREMNPSDPHESSEAEDKARGEW